MESCIELRGKKRSWPSPHKKTRRIYTCCFLADTKSMHVFFVWLVKFVWLFWFGSESGNFGTCQKGLDRSQPSHDIHPKLTAQKTHGAGVKCIFLLVFVCVNVRRRFFVPRGGKVGDFRLSPKNDDAVRAFTSKNRQAGFGICGLFFLWWIMWWELYGYTVYTFISSRCLVSDILYVHPGP